MSEQQSGWTRHGHRIPGVVQIGKPKSVARCGGPGLCAQCSVEAARETPTQPPSAPETDVSEWVAELTEPHRDSYPMGNINHGTPDNPNWGTFCVECKQSWPCDVSRLLERVRVVEGERDAYKRGWVEADVRADYAAARAESAEAAHAALVAAVEALADDFDTAVGFRGAATSLRALLAGGAR